MNELKKTKAFLVLGWIFQILGAIMFIFAGTQKFLGGEELSQKFQEWGYFAGFQYIVGVLEIIGAILVLFPKYIKYATLLLCTIMIGAIVTHIIDNDYEHVIEPIIFAIPIILAYIFRRKL